MSKSLEDILGFAPLTEALRATASGVPNPFPQEFFNVAPANRIIGDRAKYVRLFGERRTSMRAQYGSPARRRSLKDIGDQTVRCTHNYESINIDYVMLQKLRSFEQYQQDEGVDWLRYQIAEAAQRQMNSRIIGVASALSQGALYWDTDGNVLPSSSGADANQTVDFGIPATHKNQINGIIDASWALHNTDIPTHLRKIQQFAAQETGVVPTTALYGINIPKYIQQNDFCMAYLSRDGQFRTSYKGNQIPDGLFGIDRWIPVYTTFFEDSGGTTRLIWDDDLLVLVPNVSQPNKMNWWAMYEGSFPVPKTIDVQRNPDITPDAFDLQYGMFSYAVGRFDPPAMEVFYGDTFLPGLRGEKFIYQIDTTP